MSKDEALKLIDEHKNKLVNPVEMLRWTHLRVIIDNVSNEEWAFALEDAEEVLSK